MSYNTPVYHLQQGSVLVVGASGTILVESGGSIQSSGGIALGGTLTVGVLALGGTAGRWAFGTTTMTAGGSAIVNTGLTTILSAVATPITAGTVINGGAGTYAIQQDAARYANGSAIFMSVAGGTVTPGGGTIAWAALGL